MAQEIQAKGIVLRRGYLGEYDKWVSLLSPDLGKLRLR
ncbi:MAG: recombination protein O N-terminal domain-containing protein, partial [Fimbriimonadales bacterium]